MNTFRKFLASLLFVPISGHTVVLSNENPCTIKITGSVKSYAGPAAAGDVGLDFIFDAATGGIFSPREYRGAQMADLVFKKRFEEMGYLPLEIFEQGKFLLEKTEIDTVPLGASLGVTCEVRRSFWGQNRFDCISTAYVVDVDSREEIYVFQPTNKNSGIFSEVISSKNTLQHLVKAAAGAVENALEGLPGCTK